VGAGRGVRGVSRLSFLQRGSRAGGAWKAGARRTVRALLPSAPPPADPRAEVLERADRGEYIEQRVAFSTTPDVRVPAFLLVPKAAAGRRAPGIVALHDHGGFYLWGKEKLVERPDEHPSLPGFKRGSYARP